IVPKSRGGDSWSWENLVTACMSCNHRKGDRLPEAAGLQLRRRPYEPRCDVYAIFLPYLRHDAYSAWRDFLFIGEGAAASGA
ncbi:MAG: HNH endonuclease, partial [Chloroflexi bacterium]|nr:HNH endonuclease [Chloroflexota bacterium]